MPAKDQSVLFHYGVTEWLAEPDTAFDAFLTGYRFRGRRLRASSFAIYQGMFGRLRMWAHAQGIALFDLDEYALDRFLTQRRLSPETRHRYLLLFTTLFGHLTQIKAGGSGLSPPPGSNPAHSLLLEQRAPTREDPDFLTQEEVQRFVQALPAGTGWKKVRDRALAYMLLGSGLRSSEVLSLKTSDLQMQGGELQGIWVQAQKPHPARQVPLHRWAVDEVTAWLELRQRYAVGEGPPSARGKPQILVGNLVFPSNLAGAALNPLTLFRLVKSTLDLAGLVKRYEGPTLLRNSCGARWLERHEPLQVSLWLGHATVRTTELLLPKADRRT